MAWSRLKGCNVARSQIAQAYCNDGACGTRFSKARAYGMLVSGVDDAPPVQNLSEA